LNGLSTEVTDAQLISWQNRAQEHAGQSVAHAILIGRALNARKSTLKRGEYKPMLDELGLNQRTAHLYRQLATAYGESGSPLPLSPGMSIRQALRQLRGPTERRCRAPQPQAKAVQRHLDKIVELLADLPRAEKERWANTFRESILHNDREDQASA